MRITELEKVLVSIHALCNTKFTETLHRRFISTLICIIDLFLGERTSENIDILPDGIDSRRINFLLDFFKSTGLISISHGIITMTNRGQKLAEELLANPDKKYARIIYHFIEDIADDITDERLLELLVFMLLDPSKENFYKLSRSSRMLYSKMKQFFEKIRDHEKNHELIFDNLSLT